MNLQRHGRACDCELDLLVILVIAGDEELPWQWIGDVWFRNEEAEEWVW